MSPAEAVRVFGVSPDSIHNWRHRQETEGTQGLRSGRPGRKPGERTKLTPAQEQALTRALVEYEPHQLGVGSTLWTATKVAALVQQLFGTTFTDRGIRKILRRPGLTFQRPDRRAFQADPQTQQQWTEQTWPALRERARAQGERVMFADQVGVRSDHLAGRTWGLQGHTPSTTRSGDRFGVNAMSAISPTGKLYLADEVITDRQRMRSQVRSFFRSVQRLAGHVRSYFQAPHTSYITRTI